VAVVEIEHGANRIRRDSAMVLNQPFDPLLPVGKKILWVEPRPLDDWLAAPLSGHGLDQGAFGPINVFHDRSLTRSRPGVPAATQLMAADLVARFNAYFSGEIISLILQDQAVDAAMDEDEH
jgi:hypothetical protein